MWRSQCRPRWIRRYMHTVPQSGDHVIVAMSGGVDSSVCAALLKKQGYNVRGIYMRNWDARDEHGVCTSDKDWEDVQRVCDHIGIPCTQVDFVKEYWNNVFEQVLDDYAAGLTPNPDIACNQYIKFGALLERIPKDCWLATGHYCRRSPDGKLFRGRDRNKDQSYYLSSVHGSALQRTFFPLGEIACKDEVKTTARQLGLHVASKPESMGICFVGQRKRFADFLAQYIDQPPGPAVDPEGNVIGQHRGLFGYTIGQASRICHGSDKWFVAEKRLAENTLVCVPNSSHPALFHSACVARNWVWIHPEASARAKGNEPVDVQIRYRQAPVRGRLTENEDGSVTVNFEEPIRGVAAGQQAVIWNNEWCLGSGVITEAMPAFSEHDRTRFPVA